MEGAIGMSSQKSKFRELITTPAGALVVLLIFALLVALVIMSFNRLAKPSTKLTSELDPASGEYVVYGPPTGGELSEFEKVGFDNILQKGMTGNLFDVFIFAVKDYAEQNDVEIKRLSYVKDSLDIPKPYVFDYGVVYNVDQTALKVRVDSSAGWKNILGMKITFWDENDKEVYHLEIDENNVCDFRECVLYDDGY